MCRQAFRLEKNLVRLLSREAIHLVFDARAVTRAHALDGALKHRAAVKAAANDVVRSRVRVRDPARHLAGVHRCLPHEAEHRQRRGGRRAVLRRHAVARLHLQSGEVDRAPVDARRGAGFQAALRQLQFLEPRRQRNRRRITRAAGCMALHSHMNAPIQEGSSRQHHAAAAKAHAALRGSADHLLTFEQQIVTGALKQPQVRLVLQAPTNRCPVQHAVGLRTRGPHGRALRDVENAELNPRFVGGQGHRAAQRVDFLDQMTLADPADRRVATHLPQRFDVVRQQQRRHAHARTRQCRLGAGVAAADHDDLELLGKPHEQSRLRNLSADCRETGPQPRRARGATYRRVAARQSLSAESAPHSSSSPPATAPTSRVNVRGGPGPAQASPTRSAPRSRARLPRRKGTCRAAPSR